MTTYRATFFTDPYDLGACDVLEKDTLENLIASVVSYFQDHPECGYLLQEIDYRFGKSKGLSRSNYVEINKRLGRF